MLSLLLSLRLLRNHIWVEGVADLDVESTKPLAASTGC